MINRIRFAGRIWQDMKIYPGASLRAILPILLFLAEFAGPAELGAERGEIVVAVEVHEFELTV